jgi:hypothetical protein
LSHLSAIKLLVRTSILEHSKSNIAGGRRRSVAWVMGSGVCHGSSKLANGILKMHTQASGWPDMHSAS